MESLGALVRIPSVGGSDAEIEVQETCARWLADLDAEVDRWDLDLEGLVGRPPGRGGGPVTGSRRGGDHAGCGHPCPDPAGPRRRRTPRRPGELARLEAVRRRDPRRVALRSRRGGHEGRGGRQPGGSADPPRRRRAARTAAGGALRGGRGGRRTGCVRDAAPRPSRGRCGHHRADERAGHHRHRRSADLPDRGRRPVCARQHAHRGGQRVRGVPPALRRPDAARGRAQPRPRPALRRSAALRPVVRDRPGRRVVQQRPGPAGGRGPLRGPATRSRDWPARASRTSSPRWCATTRGCGRTGRR